MLINLIYKSPIWSNIDEKSRLLRVLVIGVLCYVAIHSYLYSQSNEYILKYRNYFMYLACVDILAILTIYYLSESKVKPKLKRKLKKNNKVDNKLINDMSPDILINTQTEIIPQAKMKKSNIEFKVEPKIESKAESKMENNKMDLFVTQDEITTNSIPVYKSKNKKEDMDSIPVYKNTTKPE